MGRVAENENLEEVIQLIQKEGFYIDQDIIKRQDGRGIQISESVNIDGNLKKTIFSQEEQKRIVSIIKELSEEQLRHFIELDDIDVGKRILEILEATDEEKTENRYFAEAIVDALDFEKIFKNVISEERKTIKSRERELLLQKLEVADCKRLYNAFKKAGVAHDDISGFIINLLMDNGYKQYNFEELSKAEDLDGIIEQNVKNGMLKNTIVPFRFEDLLENKDNAYEIAGTHIKLRDFQKEAIDEIERIYNDKRFAGVVLPTGAGKSFVAITEMLKFKNKNIVYFAPQIEILNQIQKHIIKNVLGLQILTEEEIKELNGKNPPPGKIHPKEVKQYISKVFPHLKLYCYQSLAEKDKETKERELREILSNCDADLIVFDELHRAGAETWEPLIKELIEKNKKSKILGITATPIRDSDKKDMMEILARYSGDYTEEEIINGEYLAKELYLVDAIQEGLVVEPKIVMFNFILGETEQYQEIKRMYEKEKNPVRKAKLKETLSEMDKIITDTSEFEQRIQGEKDPIRRKELEKIYIDLRKKIKSKDLGGIGSIIQVNLTKKDGRYIVFIPQNSTSLPTEEYVQKEIKKIKEMVKDIDDSPEIEYLLSKRKNADNIKALSNFENSESDHLKLLVAIDKLNEGVHVTGINGEIMLRKIGPGLKILYLQQFGRVVFAVDPENPIKDEDIPVVFDVYSNYLVHNMHREINKKTPTSDYQRLKSIIAWINKHGYFPDINSENLNEARKAINIKKIQIKYAKYLNRNKF